MERRIRMLVANRPRIMRESIISTFAGQPDIEILGEVTEDAEILGRVQETQPDFLFLDLEENGKRPSLCESVLRLYPEVSIIAVALHNSQSVKYWATFDIHSSVFEASEEAILAVMRKKTAYAGEGS
ncbi:MAG TPA: hypothetical protein VMG82_31665 [Candidatus Sulfotelmatobacter sp.]|nr:hypothetical protein [Candidatus Sulfotelmatobacter sp.]